MSNAVKTDYMEHPLVHAYLRDFDCALQGIASDEATMIRQSVNEHPVSEFAADKSEGTPKTIVREALDKLGPVEAITVGLTGRDTDAVEPVMGKSYILSISAPTVVSALLVPFGTGFSIPLSMLAIVLTVKLSSSRARGILLTVNAAVLAIASVYLILAFTTAGALVETVHSSGGFQIYDWILL